MAGRTFRTLFHSSKAILEESPEERLAPPFQGLEALADIALVPLKGMDKFLVAPRDPALCPLVGSSQPAQEALW
jgi:hypothetical protein